MKLTGKQHRYLRSLGHHLKPLVMIGKSGLTAGVFQQVDAALEDHELIKVRFGRSFEDDLNEALDSIFRKTGAALAGRLGRTALLYRAREKEPLIRLPGRDEGAGT